MPYLCIHEIVFFVGLIVVHQGRALKRLIIMTQVDNQQLCSTASEERRHLVVIYGTYNKPTVQVPSALWPFVISVNNNERMCLMQLCLRGLHLLIQNRKSCQNGVQCLIQTKLQVSIQSVALKICGIVWLTFKGHFPLRRHTQQLRDCSLRKCPETLPLNPKPHPTALRIKWSP